VANADAVLSVCREHPALRVPDFRCDKARCEADCPVRAGCTHAQYKCNVYVRPERLATGWSRDRIAAEINSRGVPCYQGSCSEVYLETAFDNTGWRPEARLPVARELGETSLMFLVHPGLTADEIQRTGKALGEVMKLAAA
jgi:dTDP-4-amino-4,6-dideoxygalactose transaminase